MHGEVAACQVVQVCAYMNALDYAFIVSLLMLVYVFVADRKRWWKRSLIKPACGSSWSCLHTYSWSGSQTVAEFWSSKRKADKEEQEARMKHNLRVFFALQLPPPIVVEHHFSEKTLYIRIPGHKTIRFFLHKNMWRYNDVLYNGDLIDLCTWLYKRLDKSANSW